MVRWSTANEMMMGAPRMFLVGSLNVGVWPDDKVGRVGLGFAAAGSRWCVKGMLAGPGAVGRELLPRDAALAAVFFVAAFFEPFDAWESAFRFAVFPFDAAAARCFLAAASAALADFDFAVLLPFDVLVPTEAFFFSTNVRGSSGGKIGALHSEQWAMGLG